MANKKLGEGQNRQLKAEFARDKTANPTAAEKREVAKRQGSTKKTRK
jgi:hypothetical protein